MAMLNRASGDICQTIGLLFLPWVIAAGGAWLAMQFPKPGALPMAIIMLLIGVFVLGYEWLLGRVTRRIVKADRDTTHDKIVSSPPADADVRLIERCAPSDVAEKQEFEQALARIRSGAQMLTLDSVKERYELSRNFLDRLQTRINDEYSDIAARTAWLLTGQAFLLGAFVAILNSSHLPPQDRQWFAAGVAVAGAVISGVLSLATYLGHALTARLKVPRDALEEQLAGEIQLPRSGVPTEHVTHLLGHYATRYLPTFAYIAWISLAVVVFNQGFGFAEDPVPALGWTRYPEPSPSFPIGAATYEASSANSKGCRDQTKAAQDWAEHVVRAWRARRTPSDGDTLILIGGVDRINESRKMRDTALAEARAKTIQTLLIDTASQQARDPRDMIAERQVQRHVTGARHPDAPAAVDCNQPDLAVDRTVEVWIPD